MSEEIVPEIKFDHARDADDYPAREELEYAFRQSDGDDQKGIGEELLARDTGIQIIDSASNDLREENPDAVIE